MHILLEVFIFNWSLDLWAAKNIDIDISNYKRERRDHDSRFACVFRPAGSRSVKWDTWRASPRHNQCTAAGKNVCNFITTFFTWEADWNFELVQMVSGTLGALSFIFTMENCCLGQVLFWACSNTVRHAFSFVIENSCLRQVEFWDCALDIVLLRTHGVRCVVSFMLENACLRQVEFWDRAIILENLTGDCFVTHAWCPLCVFFGNFLLEAGGILRLWILDIVLLRMHGVRCVFSFVLENACLRQVEFWACSIILGQLDCRLFR